MLLLNQRGFAKFLLCRECGFVPECPSCSTSLTYHERGNFLICHHCGYRIPTPPVCPECGSPYLKKFGAGTQRVEAELRVLLDETPGVGPGVPIVRMDADTTSGKGAHQRLLEEFAAADAAVLLGTQMIAKGLDFEDVTLVGVINADTMLKLPDYRAAERTFDARGAGGGPRRARRAAGPRAGADLRGRRPAIRAAAAYDRALFLRDELPKRRMLGYPPYVRMANVLVWGKDEPAVRPGGRAATAGWRRGARLRRRRLERAARHAVRAGEAARHVPLAHGGEVPGWTATCRACCSYFRAASPTRGERGRGRRPGRPAVARSRRGLADVRPPALHEPGDRERHALAPGQTRDVLGRMGARSEDRCANAQSYSAAESTNRCGFEDDPSTTA